MLTTSCLKKQNIIITGASSGLGKHIAEHFCQLGAHVYNLDKATPSKPQTSEYVYCDLTQPRTIELALDNLLSRGPITGFIANAGQYLLASIEDTSPYQLQQLFATNVFGHYQCLQTLLPHFKQYNFGRIVVIGSEQACLGRSHSSAYAMTKAALLQMTKSIAAEIPKNNNIRINCLCPASIEQTGMHHQAVDYFSKQWQKSPEEVLDLFDQELPTGQSLTPEEVAQWCAWLCQGNIQASQGAAIMLDGGMSSIR